jgi:hypothetical protein
MFEELQPSCFEFRISIIGAYLLFGIWDLVLLVDTMHSTLCPLRF